MSCEGAGHIGRIAAADIDRLESEFEMLKTAPIGFTVQGRIEPGDVTTHRDEPVPITIIRSAGGAQATSTIIYGSCDKLET